MLSVLSREVSKTPGNWSSKKIFAKVAENGSVVPAGPKFATDQLGQWFKGFTGRVANADELKALTDFWGPSSHISLAP